MDNRPSYILKHTDVLSGENNSQNKKKKIDPSTTSPLASESSWDNIPYDIHSQLYNYLSVELSFRLYMTNSAMKYEVLSSIRMLVFGKNIQRCNHLHLINQIAKVQDERKRNSNIFTPQFVLFIPGLSGTISSTPVEFLDSLHFVVEHCTIVFSNMIEYFRKLKPIKCFYSLKRLYMVDGNLLRDDAKAIQFPKSFEVLIKSFSYASAHAFESSFSHKNLLRCGILTNKREKDVTLIFVKLYVPLCGRSNHMTLPAISLTHTKVRIIQVYIHSSTAAGMYHDFTVNINHDVEALEIGDVNNIMSLNIKPPMSLKSLSIRTTHTQISLMDDKSKTIGFWRLPKLTHLFIRGYMSKLTMPHTDTPFNKETGENVPNSLKFLMLSIGDTPFLLDIWLKYFVPLRIVDLRLEARKYVIEMVEGVFRNKSTEIPHLKTYYPSLASIILHNQSTNHTIKAPNVTEYSGSIPRINLSPLSIYEGPLQSQIKEQITLNCWQKVLSKYIRIIFVNTHNNLYSIDSYIVNKDR